MSDYKFNIELTKQELEVISAALHELPMKVSRPVLDTIVRQYTSILKEHQVPEVDNNV